MGLDVWEMAKELVKESVDNHSYKNWFVQTKLHFFENGVIHVAVPNKFVADWLRTHYQEIIDSSVSEAVGEPCTVVFVTVSETALSPAEANRESIAPPKPIPLFARATAAKLNPRFLFDNFVVGPSNRFAHAAALAVADSPAASYNPLFLYGGVGLGKTHLLQGIGHAMIGRRDNPLIVVYMSSEEFTNELIDSIRNKSTQKFRSKYRQVDALLIDDIQFIAGKESTQEEFFHTFNALYDARKQIVISSDKPPKEIPSLQERLVSRFEWGLVADLQPPDTETRIAILQKKAEDLGMEISGAVIHYIASLATSNIRELEGALIRVRAYSSLTREPVTIELVQESLRELVGRAELKQVTPDLIQKVVAEHYDLRIADLKSRNKQRAVAFPRQIAMFLCKDMIPTISLAEIGDAFGGKDHSTVHHACKKVEDEIRTDLPLRRTVEHLQALARE